ncbi:hypothetical protein [Brevibacillus agri]|uniref:hypothetical protein n=1 Tax=Brevibacillus agri TaxID=51101 RepID=UPI00116FF0E7|nr:hypothetical protein [Brevibacillus agri]MED1695280.1 hypothetical protein [Brevibacillus agri]MED1729522.1 hypothetical protein [Brevibacillus agri]GED55700.1 hypothetical protein BBO01nite_49410 [Brevibacillus borstelensis]
MPRPKSFLKKVSVDMTLKSHKCQHVKTHILNQGDKRMKLTVGRTHEHFCIECAIKIIDSDIAKLKALREALLSE